MNNIAIASTNSDMQYSQNPVDPFDFDTWAALANDSPDAFDELKQRYIEAIVLEYCRSREIDPRKSRGLQWRIDMEIRKSRTTLKSCLHLSSAMWDSFLEMRKVLDLLLVECRNYRVEVTLTQSSAKFYSASAQVIPFSKRSK